MSTDICYLNGQYLPLSEAKVPVLDRGFIFGDGLYEFTPVYGGKMFRFAAHLARLKRGMQEIRLDNPFSDEEWQRISQGLIDRWPGEAASKDVAIYTHITRGVAPRDHRFPKGVKPTVLMTIYKLPAPAPEQYEKGVACITMDDYRWGKGHIKSISLLGNVLARQAAEDAGCAETIMFRDGYLTEAAACNVFIVRNGQIIAPPKSNYLLGGITDDFVTEVCRANAFPITIRPIAEWEVRQADEVWLTSSSKEALPVTTLDGQPVGHGQMAGKVGDVYKKVRALFHDYKVMLAAGNMIEVLQ
jgi:D-alanine transaminase